LVFKGFQTLKGTILKTTYLTFYFVRRKKKLIDIEFRMLYKELDKTLCWFFLDVGFYWIDN